MYIFHVLIIYYYFFLLIFKKDNNENIQPPKCPFCSQPATELTVNKDNANKGRKFYKCSSCDYFKWKDEYINEMNSSGINNVINNKSKKKKKKILIKKKKIKKKKKY